MKRLAKTLILLIIYFYAILVFSVVLKYGFNISLDSHNIAHLFWVNIGADILFFIVSILLCWDVLKENQNEEGKSLINRILKYCIKTFVFFIGFFIVKIIIAIVVTVLLNIFHCNVTPENQALVEQIARSYPIGMLISTVILAPVLEELIFRGSIRRIISNKVLFVIISGIVFGLIHVTDYKIPIFALIITGCFLDIIINSKLSKKKKWGTALLTIVGMSVVCILGMRLAYGDLFILMSKFSLSEAINSITYIVMGICLATIYVIYDNIYINIGVHALNNLIGYIMLFTLT